MCLRHNIISPTCFYISYTGLGEVKILVFVVCVLWRSVVEYLGCSTQDQRILVSRLALTRSLSFIFTCSPVQLDWFIKGQVVCGLPVILALNKRLLVIIRKEGSPQSLVFISGRSRNHWASIAPNHSDTHNAQCCKNQS
jgi:hypothetical protein